MLKHILLKMSSSWNSIQVNKKATQKAYNQSTEINLIDCDIVVKKPSCIACQKASMAHPEPLNIE